MKEQEYDWMARLEQDFWWYRGMRKIVLALSRDIPASGLRRCFDAGCGTGFNLCWFPAWLAGGWFAGLDLSLKALGWCRSRGLKELVHGNISQLPIRTGSLDLVTGFDILQHLPTLTHVERAVNEFYRVLQPGGWLILRVPAYDCLKSRHDEAVQTNNRFTAPYIGRLARRSGFEVQRMTYVNTILLPLAAIMRLIEQVRPGEAISGVRPVPLWMDRFFYSCLAGEAWFLRRTVISLPFGLSIMCIARKPYY
jgi:SAM-dependent methyltransferase